MPPAVSIVSPLDTHTSFGRHACRVIEGFQRLGIRTVARPIKLRNPEQLPDNIRNAIQHGENDCPVEIIIGHPELAPTPGKRTLYYSAWESTRLPRQCVDILNKCERVIVPSDYCSVTHSASGVDRPIDVVPLGCDDCYAYVPFRMSGPFIFSCAGNLGNGFKRKGVQRVVDLFREAFPAEDNVRLNVKLFPGNAVNTHGDSRIKIYDHFMEEVMLKAWMAESHCFVHFGVGAFESQVLEFMAIGRACIAMKFGGHADFFSSAVGLEVAHRLVPADMKWNGHGCFAEPDRESAVAAMRWARSSPDFMESLGLDACKSVRHLTWQNSISKLAAVVPVIAESAKVEATKVLELSSGTDPLDDVTVCITSFKRSGFLRRAIESVCDAGFRHIAVSTMEPDAGVIRELEKLKVMVQFASRRVISLDVDLGCNELWLRAAYAAKTKRVIILHDDDYLSPDLGKVYRETIFDAMNSGYAVTWRGAHAWDDGRITPTEYRAGPTAACPVGDLEAFLLQRGRLSLSPIVTVFDREVLIHALKEADEMLTSDASYLHPGMLLGTEVLAHLRQAQSCKAGWLYVDKVLSYYGVHDGSGTVAAEKSGDLSKLTAGYDAARSHFERNRGSHGIYRPKILLSHSVFEPDSSSVSRIAAARWTWSNHFRLGEVVDFPISARVRCDGPGMLPYLRDVLDDGCAHAMPEDIIAYINADIALTQSAPDEIRKAISRSGGVAVGFRRSMPVPSGRMLMSAKAGKIDGGVDLIAVTPGWWREHRLSLPDMVVGEKYWDWVFRIYVERKVKHAADMFDGTYHEPHDGVGNRNGKPVGPRLINALAAKEFFTSAGMSAEAESIQL